MMMTSMRVLLFLLLLSEMAESYVIDGNSPSSFSANSILSRFHNVRCELFMTVDRTPPPPPPASPSSDYFSSHDGSNFASVPTGSKLGLPLDIKFSSSVCTDFGMSNEPLLLGDNNAPSSSVLSVQPLCEPKFVTRSGQQSVKVTPGAYACELSHALTKQYFFRFVLDFPEGATRNDVTLPAERVYFMSSCWMGEDNMIEKARKWKDEILRTLQTLNTEIAELEKTSNNDVVGLAVACTRNFPKYIELLKQRKKLNSQVEMLEDGFPLDRPLIRGPNNTVLLREGVIAVKRVFAGKVGYYWIGTFSFKEFFDGEE